MYQPLADRIRPKTLDDMVGQEHLIGKDGILRRIIGAKNIPNMVFYGPSGIGKTTLANIIAENTGRRLHKLNATTASIADIKDMTSELDTLLAPQGILLYLDEIQYFNKKQQQSLLEFIENGSITLIASTAENPYFCVYNAILSRSTVFEFKPVTVSEIKKTVIRAFAFTAEEMDAVIGYEDGVIEHISTACGGDVRKAINAVELLTAATPVKDGRMQIGMEDAVALSQRSSMKYDRDGDSHYDIMSAFHKCIRGSDPDAALHYLARLLEAGDILSPCRRLLCIACEDIGLAYPAAISIVKACVDSAVQLGLPEARLPLAQAAILLATAPKSNSVVTGINRALEDVQKGNSGEIPANLRDAHYGGAQKLGRGTGYKYPHDFEGSWVLQQYLPEELKSAHYYEYGNNRMEQASKKHWDDIKGGKKLNPLTKGENHI